MNNRIYIWDKFTIPEWGDHWFLPVEVIDKIKKQIEKCCHISVTWFRTNEWLHWELGRPIDEATRLILQENITDIIKTGLPAGKDIEKILLRWTGSVTTIDTAMALGRHIQ